MINRKSNGQQMNRFAGATSWAAVAVLLGVVMLSAPSASAQRQLETLGRGGVALRVGGSQVQVSWRMLGTDPDAIAFNLYRSSNGGGAVRLNRDPLPSPPTISTRRPGWM